MSDWLPRAERAADLLELEASVLPVIRGDRDHDQNSHVSGENDGAVLTYPVQHSTFALFGFNV